METPPIRKITIRPSAHHPKKRGGRLRRLFERLGRHKDGKPKTPIRKFLSYAALVVTALVLAGGIAGFSILMWVARDLPDPNNIVFRNVPQTTKIYDHTGKTVLYEIHGDQNRTVVELKDISPYLVDATISLEDKNFYTHHGFVISGYLRAFYENLIHHKTVQGGSTITEQFVKNAMLSPRRTYTRKIKELVLAYEIEQRFTKDQILKLYLNEISYGAEVYGIQSASETYFGKPAKDLTISEAAVLAAIPEASTYYSPYGSHTKALMTRAHYAIDVMQQQGYITQAQADAAKKDDPLSRLKPENQTIIAPHFVFYVRDLLVQKFGEQMVERGGLKVITTLDTDLQQKADAAVKKGMTKANRYGGTDAALMSFDPKNGNILAMVGSADYFNNDINGKYNALLGTLQPGSSIKPVAYASAFEQGYTPDTVVYDVNTDFNGYKPLDYDLKERGPVTLREALAESLNIPAVKVLYLGGLDNFVNLAQRMGYTTLNDPSHFGLSAVLGGAGVHPIEHINAYGAFANDGVLSPVRAILKVEDKDGKVLIDNTQDQRTGKRVMDQQISRLVTSILSDNAARAPVFGQNNPLTLGDRPVGAKTGTTNDFKDAWTVGFTPSLVTGVWVGNADGSPMKRGAAGETVAAPIWNSYMRAALDGTPVETFPAPDPITTGKPILDGDKQAQVMVKIDKISGKLATDNTPPNLVEEKGFGQPHSILFFVDRKDPRGPVPSDPSQDPMYTSWEKGVSDWYASQNITLSSNPPPTTYDDIHVPENVPDVSFVRPTSGESIGNRNFTVQMNTYARRGVVKVTFSADGNEFDSLGPPFSGTITLPNQFGKGFHTLTATAYDDVGNSASTSVTINVTADALPLEVKWIAPYSQETLSRSQFPYNIRFNVGDIASITSLHISAVDENGVSKDIGIINDPVLPNMSIKWNQAPAPGNYDIEATAQLKDGENVSSKVHFHVY